MNKLRYIYDIPFLLPSSNISSFMVYFSMFMDNQSISILVSVICLILLFSYFSLLTGALPLANPYKAQIKADEGSFFMKTVVKILDYTDRYHASLMLLNSFVVILLTMLSIDFCTLNFVSLDLIWNVVIGASFSLIVLLIIGYLFRSVGRNIPDTIIYYTSFPFFVISYILYPFMLLIELFLKMTKKKEITNDSEDEEEVIEAVEQITDDGLIEKEQSQIVSSVFDFNDKSVKEVLTPKEKIFALNIDGLTHDKLKEAVLSSPYSRIPIYNHDYDHFIGVLIVKTYFKEILSNPDKPIKKMLQPPYFVSSNMMIDDLFRGFKKNQTHLALVRNNKKHVIGMVTMEDVLEELVSDISEPNKEGGKK